jgi:hypothetical protein
MQRTRLVGGVLLVGIIVVASQCGGGGGADCVSSKCSNDPKPIVGMVQQCLDIANGPCGSQYKEQRSCLANNWKCTSDGHLDPNSQVTALAACQMKTKAYQDCAATTGDGGK